MCAPVIAAGISAVASVGMGIYSGQQQASMAAAQMQQAVQQQQTQVAMQNRQAMQQQRTANQQMQMQRTQQLQSQRLQQQQQFSQQQFQMQQTSQSQALQAQQLSSQQQFQMQQNAAQMKQAADLQFQQQQLSVQQQQKSLRFQQEQNAASRNLQIQQMNAQLADKYTQQREAVKAERIQLMKKNEVDKRVFQDSRETAERQKDLNAEEANRVYSAEQVKLEGKRREAAFEAQSILAKSIGAKGQILASGRVGQSVGILANDVERQAGIQKAQQTAMLESDRVAAIIGMDNAMQANKNADAQAEASVGFDPTMPYLPSMPQVPTFVGFEIPK